MPKISRIKSCFSNVNFGHFRTAKKFGRAIFGQIFAGNFWGIMYFARLSKIGQ